MCFAVFDSKNTYLLIVGGWSRSVEVEVIEEVIKVRRRSWPAEVDPPKLTRQSWPAEVDPPKKTRQSRLSKYDRPES